MFPDYVRAAHPCSHPMQRCPASSLLPLAGGSFTSSEKGSWQRFNGLATALPGKKC